VLFLVFRDPISGLVGDLIGKMAFTEKAPEIDVNQLALQISPADAPLEFGSRDDPADDEVGPVEALQRILLELGFDAGVPDGVFGAGTETAVRSFQQSQIGLTADGRADEVTINVLLRVFTGRDPTGALTTTPDDTAVPGGAAVPDPTAVPDPAAVPTTAVPPAGEVPDESVPAETVPAGELDGGVLPGDEFVPPSEEVPFD
jgi:peptidoglycan hydrolase-like protein with peptidoglycan-binding domain